MDEIYIVHVSVKSRERMHVSDDGVDEVDDADCRSVISGMLCSSPVLVVADPVFNFPPLTKHEVIPSSRTDLPTNRLYSPDGTTTDCLIMSGVLCISEETDFYVDDRRFGERLESFRDNSFDNGEVKLLSRMPENRCSVPRHADGGAYENATDDWQWPTRRADKAVAETGGFVNDGDMLIHACDSVNEGKSLPISTSTAVIYQPCDEPLSTTSAECSVSDTSSQSTLADCSLFSQSIVSSCQQSPSTHPESVELSSLLCHTKRCANCEVDDVISVESACKVGEDTAQENCISDETKKGTNTRRDAFGESEICSLDPTLCMLPRRLDKMVSGQDNEHRFSCDDSIETENHMVNVNGCSHQLCSRIQKVNGDASKYDIFDSSASIYDRLDKYYGIGNRRRQISCTKDMSALGRRVPFNISPQFSTASEKSSKNFDASVHVDSPAVLLSTDSTTTQPHISYPAEHPLITECRMTNAGSCSHFQSSDTRQQNEMEVRTSHQQNCRTESRDNGAEKDDIIGGNSNYKQYDENTAATSATLQSAEDSNLKGDMIMKNDSPTLATASDNGVAMLAGAAIPADGDCRTSLPKSLDMKTQLEVADASAATRDAKTRRENCVPKDLSDMESVLPADLCDENRRRSGDDATQLATKNIGNEAVSNDPSLGNSRLNVIDNQSQKPWSNPSSFVMVDIEIDESRPSTSSAVRDAHRRRLEAMKQQLMNAKLVAPASPSIDSIWNSRIAGKLTPAARSRSAVWTPYDNIFSAATTTRPSAADYQMWRTRSLQTLPGKFTSAALCNRPRDSTSDLGSEKKDIGEQADMSCDKSKSLSDLRHLPNGEPRLQAYEIGSIDAGLNNEKKTASSSSSSAVPLRPLPSEEFIRRSLERLNLPEWYLNSSLLLQKKVGTSHKSFSGSTTFDTTSCSAIDIGKPENVNWQSLAMTRSPLASHVASSSLTRSNVAATSVSDCQHSNVSDCGTVYRFATAENLQPVVDLRTSAHRKSIRRATDGVFSSTELQTNGGGVAPAEFPDGERRHKKCATKTDEQERYRCPHGKRSSIKCSRCRRKLLETGLSPTQCETIVNEYTSNRSPSESTIEATTTLTSNVFQAPTAGKDYNNFSHSIAVESVVNRKTRNRSETATRRKSSTQNRKNMPTESDQNEVAMTPNCNVIENRSSYCPEVTADGGNVEEKGQHKLSKLDAREMRNIPAVRPRSLRLRKVQSKTFSEDVVRTEVTDQNISKQKPLKSSRDNLFMDSAREIPLCEMTGSSFPRDRTPAKGDLTLVAPTKDDAQEISRPKHIQDVPAEVSDQKVAVDDDRRHERKVQRRRRRRQESIYADALSQATNVDVKKDRLTTNDNHSVIGSGYLLTELTNECDHNQEVDVELMRMHDSEQGEVATGEKRRRRRRTNRLSSEESPSGECVQFKEEYRDRSSAADLDDRTTSSFHRHSRRRLRNDPSSRLNFEPQRQDTDDPPTRPMTSDSKQKLSLQCRSQNEQAANVMPRFDSSQQCGDLERTVKLFFEGSSSMLMEDTPETASGCQIDESTSSASRRHREQPRRRLRCSTATGSNSFPVDVTSSEVISAQSQLKQDGTQFESTSNRSESSPTEQKPCLSAAARRCRRVQKSQRSR